VTLLWGFLWGVAGMSVIAGGAILGVWWERKVAARIQMRYGPQQIGPFGSLQMLADVPKLLFKEDIVPDWASHNTLSTLGGLRATSQMIAYEVPRALSVLAIVLLAGSLRPVDVVEAWRWWWLPLTAIAFIVYFISSIAEMNRGPFDIPEAESELVAGYFADYSGMRWAAFMMAEYGSMIAASLFGAAVFLGAGWPFTGALGVVALIVKTVALITVVMWVRWTLPRLRQDHLMSFCWKVLTPLALAQLVIVGVVLPWL